MDEQIVVFESGSKTTEWVVKVIVTLPFIPLLWLSCKFREVKDTSFIWNLLIGSYSFLLFFFRDSYTHKRWSVSRECQQRMSADFFRMWWYNNRGCNHRNYTDSGV